MTTFTIITSTLNALPLLKFTANSIIAQTYTHWQWIVVDGASSDGTAEWLSQVSIEKPNVKFICEPDAGIYDAWNKALPLIEGEWVIFLGAGDRLRATDTLQQCVGLLPTISPRMNLAYGWVELTETPEDRSGTVCMDHWEGLVGRWGHGRPVLPNHQGVFHRVTLFSQGKRFDTSYRIAGDTAFILPELIKNGGYFLDLPIALMLKGGISFSIKHRLLMLKEILRLNRSSGLAWRKVHYQYAAFFYHAIAACCLLVTQKLGRLLEFRKKIDK